MTSADAAHLVVFRITNSSDWSNATEVTCGDDVTKLQLERHARYEAHLLGGLLGGLLLRSVTFEVRGASAFLFEVVTSTGVSTIEVNDYTHIVAMKAVSVLVMSQHVVSV